MSCPPPDPARPDTACARPARFRDPEPPTPPLAPPIVLLRGVTPCSCGRKVALHGTVALRSMAPWSAVDEM